MLANRRQHVRQLVAPPVYVALNSSSCGGILYDASQGGLSVDIIGPAPTAEQVLLQFDIPRTRQHLEVVGQITWKNEPRNRIGMKFVDLSEASHQQIGEWLSAKPVPAQASQNLVVHDLPLQAGPFENPVPKREKASEPVASHWFEPIPKKQPSAPLGVMSPTKARDESAPIAQTAPPSGPVVHDSPNSLVQDVRSALSPRDVADTLFQEREISPEQAAIRRKWILVAALFFVAASGLAAGSWAYTAGVWNVRPTLARFKAMITDAFISPTEEPPLENVSHPSAPKAARRPHQESKSPESKQTVNTPDSVTDPQLEKDAKRPPASGFEIYDAQSGRRFLPRTSTTVTVRFERSGISGLRSGSANEPRPSTSGQAQPVAPPLSSARESQLGQVSQQTGGERPLIQVMPEYPALALQRNVQGTVVLKAIIAKDGSVQNVRLVGSPSPLNSTVLDAVRKWRYQPHYVNGEPVEVETEIIIAFAITTK